MHASILRIIRRASPVAAVVFTLACAQLLADDVSKQTDAFPVFDSYIKISGQAPSITGDKNAFQARARQSDDGSVGIEDFYYSRDLPKDVSLEIDGRALVGSEDYLGKFRLTKNEVGSFEAGYQRFRTFYDGVGGFFPRNSEWMPLNNADLHTDRSKLWLTGSIALPDRPALTISYVNEIRDGQKDSTIWGDSDFTGLPNNTPPISQVRKLVPSYINLDEHHESLQATVRQTIKDTTLQLTLLGDRTDNLDTRYVTRFPGEARPFPTPNATLLQPASKMNNQVLMQQRDGESTKTTGVTGTADTVLNDIFTLRIGGSYQLVHSDITGDRPLITSTPTATGVVPVTTATFQGLTGGSRVKVYTGNLAVDIKATKDLFVKVAVRGEDEFIRGQSSYNVLAASGTPAVTVTSTPRVDFSRLHQHSATPVLEARYTGIKNLSIYFNGSLRNLSGIEKDTSSYNPLTATGGTLANNNVSEDHGNYALGANWRQSSWLTLRSEVFHKEHQDESAGFGVNLGDYYLLSSHFNGAKFSVLAKPDPMVTFTTRYIYQTGEMSVTGFLPTYPSYDSCNAKTHTLGETIDWSPNPQCYAQLNADIVYDTINTIYPRAGVTPPSPGNLGFDTNRILQNSDNNYITGSVLVGCVVNKRTDLQAQATYYRANNGDPALAALTMPYGVSAKDYTVTLGIKYKVSAKLMLNAKIGYLESVNDTTGGNTNFRGPVGYISLVRAL